MNGDTQLLPGTGGVPSGFGGRLGLLLVRAGDEMANRGDAALNEIGLSGRAYSALTVIAHDKPGSQQELARLMGKAPALCVALLDDLEADGLVERVRDPKDRRRSIVSLTKAGAKRLKDADQVAVAVEREVLDRLSDDERAQLAELLHGAMSRADTVHVV